MDVKLKFTRQGHERGKIELTYIPTNGQVADGLTKRSTRIKHERFKLSLLKQIDKLVSLPVETNM